MLVEGAVFITLWIYADTKIELWVYGLLWSIGFRGVWGPATTYTTEMYPASIRGIGNRFPWAEALQLGYGVWPYGIVWSQESWGPWNTTLTIVTALMLVMERCRSDGREEV